MSKQYFFEAGSFQDLSYTELVSVFNLYGVSKDRIQRFTDKVFIVRDNEVSEEIVKKIYNRLGGFVRYGYLLDQVDTFLAEYIAKETKVTFGVSVLGNSHSKDHVFLRKLSNELKDELKRNDISSRFIRPLSGETELNAAQVLKNEIVEKGFELCIIKSENAEIYGCTMGVQDIEGFAMRDYDRPHTDVKMGTLPPKLARMMINLAGLKEGIIWDPFCGSGTIPMEAAVLGFDILGSDIDENALEYTEKNIEWASDKGLIGIIKYDIFHLDVKEPDNRTLAKLRKTPISAVVCEPFMGPPQRSVLFSGKAELFLKRVEELYKGLFDILHEVTHEGFVVVMIIPSYKTSWGWKTIGVRDIVGKRWEVLNTELSGGRDLKWSRKNSIITRNIFILRRK
jgi:tRNA G10  N-methylase Trm11